MRRMLLVAACSCSPPAPTARRPRAGSRRDPGPQVRCRPGRDQFIGQPGTSETGAAIMQATNAARAPLGAARN